MRKIIAIVMCTGLLVVSGCSDSNAENSSTEGSPKAAAASSNLVEQLEKEIEELKLENGRLKMDIAKLQDTVERLHKTNMSKTE
ncbi:hypothetical protein N0O92_08925 [Alkalihalobacillus sp. MEB130]|uniref:hypothetical protein n=1 Tax=Alkalihalobacillus sp. MEB130 TaxID=2976704 RepID=UPI0028E05509|nr:hypothetical protein [Alkalihalobacillus sp. MEB130]MDT8860355.1 hypothetical protein [Alkalihalobacillus sp. MEB130]